MSTDKPEPIARHLVYEKVIGEKGIWIADVDGSGPRLLVPNAERPVISPDGKWVAYAVDCFKGGPPRDCDKAYVVSSEPGKTPRLIAEGTGWTKAWSPDSKAIVAIQPLGERLVPDRLVRIDLASGDEVTLAHGQFWGWSFSPDGKQIVYASEHEPSSEHFAGERIDLFVVSADGSGDPKRITDTGDNAEPVWGPKSIAYAKVISCLETPSQEGCANNTWGRHEIWQVQPDGSNRRPIVSPLPKRFLGQGYLGLVPINWSGDGRALLAGWLNEWGRIPIAVDPETGDVRQLAENQASDGLSLSRDGKLALVETIDNVGSYPESNAVLIAPYAGGKAQLVASGATGASWNR